MGPQWRAIRCDLGENPYPRLKLHWLVKLQWLAAAAIACVLPSRRASYARAGGAGLDIISGDHRVETRR